MKNLQLRHKRLSSLNNIISKNNLDGYKWLVFTERFNDIDLVITSDMLWLLEWMLELPKTLLQISYETNLKLYKDYLYELNLSELNEFINKSPSDILNELMVESNIYELNEKQKKILSILNNLNEMLLNDINKKWNELFGYNKTINEYIYGIKNNILNPIITLNKTICLMDNFLLEYLKTQKICDDFKENILNFILLKGFNHKNNLVISINSILSHSFDILLKYTNEEKISRECCKKIFEFISFNFDIKFLNKGWNIILDESFILIKDFIKIKQISVPMVYKPSDWIFDKNDYNFYLGGFLKNNRENIIKLLEINKEFVEKNQISFKKNETFFNKLLDIHKSKPVISKIIVNDNYGKEINSLQKIGFRIEIDLFLKIFENFNVKDFPLNTLFLKNKINLLDLIDERTQTYDSYTEYTRLSMKIKIDKIIANEKEVLEENIIKLCYTLNFLYNFYIRKTNFNELIDNSVLYIPLQLDFRGRQYYNSYFSHMQNTYIRPFISLNKEINIWKTEENNRLLFFKFYLMWQTKKIKFFNEKEIISYCLDNLTYDSRKPMNKIIFFEAKQSDVTPVISLDACASMIQIISLLIRDPLLAKHVNLQNDSDSINDPYNLLINKLKNKDLDDTEKSIISERSIVKYVIMTYIYGSTPYSMCDHLYEMGHLKLFKKNELISVFYKIINEFNENFQEFKNLKLLFKAISKYILENMDCEIKMFVDEEYPKFCYKYKKNRNITISKNDDKKMMIKFKKISEENDEKKIKSAILANFIHFLDGYVLHKTRINLLNKGIETLGIHDCFLINPYYYQECVYEYNKNLCKILDIDILESFGINRKKFDDFLEKNNFNKNDLVEIKFILDIKKFKNNICKDMLIKSRFSLLPS